MLQYILSNRCNLGRDFFQKH